MIPFPEAAALVRRELTALPRRTITVPLLDAVGRVLAEEVRTDTPLPRFTNAAVDGVAVRFSEEHTAWTVTAEITAGHFRPVPLRDAEAVSIMTGAALPEDADTVIPVEDLHTEGTTVRLREGARYRKGMNLRRCGEDMADGVTAVPQGTVISPSVIPLLAACGKGMVSVRSPLSAAIITTGDELVPHAEVPVADQVRATNRPMLLSAVAAAGITAHDLGIIRDDERSVTEALQSLLHNDTFDLLITTGGVSVGTRDLLRLALHGLGAEELFWKVGMKPGKPVMVSRLSSGAHMKYVISLPGNPLSAFVTWTTLFRPALSPDSLPSIKAEFRSTYSKSDDKRHFLCGRFEPEQRSGALAVSVTGSQSSGGMAALARAQCLIVVPEEVTVLQPGDTVECILI